VPENLSVASIVLGGVLLLIALVGGGFKIFAAEVTGHAGGWARVISGGLGSTLVLAGIFGSAGPPASTSQRDLQSNADLSFSQQASTDRAARQSGALTSALESTEATSASGWTPASANVKSELMRAVKHADDVESQARSTGDARILSQVYGTTVAAEIAEDIGAWQQQGLWMETRLVNQDFREFLVSRDGMQAQITLVERWENTFRRGAQCVAYQAPHDTPQTISLSKAGTTWLLTEVVHHSQGPSPAQCPRTA